MYKAANEQVTIPTKTDLMHPLDTDDTCISLYTDDTCISLDTDDTCISLDTDDTCISIDLSLQFRLHAK
jgi:hypothetical protein